MKTSGWVITGSLASILTTVCMVGSAAPPRAEPPALVVVITVDQMRADYLDRFGPLLTGGLATLVREAVVYEDAVHDHAFTATAPGHAALATGTHPSRSGIVANDWWDRERGQRWYAVEDPDAPLLGFPNLPGRSPSTMLRSTVGDWLKEASPHSKVFSVAIKDRVAVVMGGQKPDGVYWYEYESGRYVTSSYYASKYPEWLVTFNDSGPVHEMVQQTWERSLPDSIYLALAREDDFAPEAAGDHTTFPHVVNRQREDESPFNELAHTPYGDRLTLALASELLLEEALGRDDAPDLLFVGMSSADLIGHRYGPFSQEVMDYYLRLDAALARFFDFLDEQIGAERYAVILSSDHGVAPMPEEASRRGLDAHRVSTDDFRQELITGLQEGLVAGEIYDQPSLALMTVGLVTHFSGADVTAAQLTTLRKATAAAIRESPVVAETFTYDQFLSPDKLDSPYENLFRHSFHPARAADVIINFREHYVYPASIPATHGAPYRYDMHVPLLIRAGHAPSRVARPVRTVDVAPTLARLLGIAVPDDLDGAVLTDALPN